MNAGDFGAARALIDAAEAITTMAGGEPIRWAALLLSAWRGEEQCATELVEASTAEATARHDGLTVACGELATAVLHNSLLHPLRAQRAAERASDNAEVGFGTWALPELVEAAARSRHDDQAARALDVLTDRVRLSGTDLALGIAARSAPWCRTASRPRTRTTRRSSGWGGPASRSSGRGPTSSTVSGSGASAG